MKSLIALVLVLVVWCEPVWIPDGVRLMLLAFALFLGITEIVEYRRG